jgi:hypothetical protein
MIVITKPTVRREKLSHQALSVVIDVQASLAVRQNLVAAAE